MDGWIYVSLTPPTTRAPLAVLIMDYIAMESISWSLQFQASMHPSDRVLERLTVLVRMDEQVNHFSVSFFFFSYIG